MAKAKKAISVNERVLATVNVGYDHPMLSWFKPHIDKWAETYSGVKPTPAMLFTAACTASRGAGKQTAAVALALREGGYSVGQLRTAFDSGPAHNHTDTLVELQRDGVHQGAGLFVRSSTGTGGGQSHTFSLTFTPKGEAWLAEQLIKHGLAKPKAKRPVSVRPKANKAKAPVDAPAVDVQPIAELVTDQPTAEQLAALQAQFNS